MHLIVTIIPSGYYAQPVGTAFQLFVFDIILLLVSLIFASKRTAVICFAIILLGNLTYYFKTLVGPKIPGTLHFAADTLARDGLLALTVIFAIGAILVIMLDRIVKQSEHLLQSIKSTNQRLERRVRERTRELEESHPKGRGSHTGKEQLSGDDEPRNTHPTLWYHRSN